MSNPDKLLSAVEVADILGVSKTTVWQRVKDGNLPKPMKFGARCSRWRTSTINAVIEQAEAEAQGEQTAA